MKSIDALPWEYTVVHSRRKTISIEIVSQNSILIKAPYFYSRSAVLDLIEKNRTKISERMERLKKIPPRPLISPKRGKRFAPVLSSFFRRVWNIGRQ